MSLTLNRKHLDAINHHAERTYPDECCGLLIGRLTETGRVVSEIWTTENTWTQEVADEMGDGLLASKTRRYWIAPQEMLAVMKAARQQGLEIVGIYHSHPDHWAIPSECDRRLAWPQYSYLIVSVVQGKVINAQSWALDDHHQFQSETLHALECPRMRRESLIPNA
ncbi:Mov34/MPN/PAD-1 family protein [Leptothermofonsia sp. ETS-13]|uniref:Mov34/MPN/PAD-1 family protein n=1 Tax=Leptothermofonsia sp. ETS-13 TaxID=3035696 RepID=UPI003BA06491